MAIVVIKHIIASNKIELRGTVTDEAMRDGGYEAVKSALTTKRIAYGEDDLNGRRTLTLLVRDNLAPLEVFVQNAMDRGFGKAVSSDCVAYFKNVLLWNIPSVTGVTGTKVDPHGRRALFTQRGAPLVTYWASLVARRGSTGLILSSSRPLTYMIVYERKPRPQHERALSRDDDKSSTQRVPNSEVRGPAGRHQPCVDPQFHRKRYP